MRFVNPAIHGLRCDAFDPHHEGVHHTSRSWKSSKKELTKPALRELFLARMSNKFRVLISTRLYENA